MVAGIAFDPDAALALVTLRTGAAALIMIRLRRDGEEVWSLALQAVADVAAALFVLAAGMMLAFNAFCECWAFPAA